MLPVRQLMYYHIVSYVTRRKHQKTVKIEISLCTTTSPTSLLTTDCGITESTIISCPAQFHGLFSDLPVSSRNNSIILSSRPSNFIGSFIESFIGSS